MASWGEEKRKGDAICRVMVLKVNNRTNLDYMVE